jgi:hypothetical protein
MKRSTSDKLLTAGAAGLAGAGAVTLIHETMRRLDPDAPRMDVLGMRAISKILRSAGTEPPAEDKLFGLTLAGDILSNSLYYSLTGSGKNAWLRGTLLGLAAGVGGVVLPGPLGLGTAPSNRTTKTKVMTVTWYLLGGLAAAAVAKATKPKR